jgi:hypothetical protein
MKRDLIAESLNSKLAELKPMVGKTFSDNHSSTNRSELVRLEDTGRGWVAITKEVLSEYNNRTPMVGFQRQPIWLVCNGFFGA